MKNDFTQLLKETLTLGKQYIKLQIDVARLTLAERLTLLLAGITLGLIAVLFAGFIILLLAFAAADLFKEIMYPALAYVSTAGVVAIILLIIYLLRKQLIINPIARMISKLFISIPPQDNVKEGE